MPSNFLDLFEDMTEPAEYERNKKFLLALADFASQCQTDAVIKLAGEIVTKAGVTLPSEDKADDIHFQCKPSELFELITKEQNPLAEKKNKKAVVLHINEKFSPLLYQYLCISSFVGITVVYI